MRAAGHGSGGRYGFWALALLWLPAGFVATALARFGWPAEPAAWLPAALSLVVVSPCGLALALACRRLWRLGYRKAAWAAAVGLGAVTVAAGLVAGLLGPLAVGIVAVALSLPVWLAWWLARRERTRP